MIRCLIPASNRPGINPDDFDKPGIRASSGSVAAGIAQKPRAQTINFYCIGFQAARTVHKHGRVFQGTFATSNALTVQRNALAHRSLPHADRIAPQQVFAP
jgi:hypothetical protein